MNKGKDIEKYGHSIEDNFNEEKFFNYVLEYCYEKKLLDESVLANIYYERMELLKVQLKYYTKDESSSVMVELAESILQCIDYTIGIYLKTFDNIEGISDELKSNRLSQMLKQGQDLIIEKILESKKLLGKINESKLKVDNYSYNDTIDYGIPLFFKEYNDFFAAHENPGSIDYQLCIGNMNYVGIEYICNYLEILSLENDFCNNFPVSEINKLLKGYDKKFELLLINIFELLLINCLGVIICGKDLKSLNISSLDRTYIKNKLEKLSLEELQKELLKYAKVCWEILRIKDKALISYIKKSTLKVASLINQGIKLNRLEAVFISFNENNRDETIYYNDGEMMENSEFKKLSEEIRDCTLVEDKISLIKNNIKSLEDLVDMLSADCLFGGEYVTYFKSLSHMEIVLLDKYMEELGFENGYEEEWYGEFNKYILSLNEKERILIRELEEKIEF
ncbi:hypothetical protein CPAST_c30210 [Clostridium pasteurianum DSM 525 = ATCC 6013]|uniref:Uncharacterized protein n=1 Tax=Clostridium pasteurianum DSM 525 = ATCC 6013 TaxID=1262449 RepID=A0A0H3J796_CLOPA|nr:DUF6179 domain-containing protein [Clostridium pasteurianum]AJA49087.1 hypothetical protein CPAST_c30210 [Clostridium pasteurianum DSM 525 = ATCC 6013]AJA53075.1 hypothetical protein CLPA_c30210 [Clostridium pasteurianum DSM 525 = ATCC 6013]AOZ76288.1 hypothetical protein AQ983_14690 [Clostridium pasteurianum DSM 525 = ATCC 6013]AOZ80084.1 hypothetical protein AQ984_14685 [Clostridium pasteurianum]ELP59024.1 hypothetical protein F502_11061 [Clostridium pasteurianum DSM 525 = ATCC 6013]